MIELPTIWNHTVYTITSTEEINFKYFLVKKESKDELL